MSSLDETPSGAPRAPTATIRGPRARIDLGPAAAPGGPSVIHVVLGERLRLGRSRPDQDEFARENNLVVRVLPCPPDPLHPNFKATKQISAGHATIDAAGGAARVTDTSSRGTLLDGAPLVKNTPTPLPDRFRLDLAGVLALEGRVIGSAAGAVAAVLLTRLENRPADAYLWVPLAAGFGPGDEALVPATEAGWVEVHGGALRCYFPEGVSVREAEVGEEATD